MNNLAWRGAQLTSMRSKTHEGVYRKAVQSLSSAPRRIENNLSLCDIEDRNSVPVFFVTRNPLIIPLQWFSDEDEDAPGKTEQPTEYKLDRLRREEGQVVKSQELIGAIGLLLPALLLLFIGSYMLRTCVEMVKFFFSRSVEMDPTRDALIVLVFFRYFIKLALPILGVAFVSSLFSNFMQVGFVIVTKPLIPNFSKVLPKIGKFFKRIFSWDGMWNFIKSIVKMLIIGGISFGFIYSNIEKLLNLQKADVYTGLTTVAWIAIQMLIIAAFLLLALAIPDYMFQRWRFRERNKMTRYEIKEESKQHEADPQIQNRIRSRFRELLRQSIATVVPQADVVITNPTHLAIALQFDQGTMPGPKVTAIGYDEIAARIRQIAKENEVPLVENKPLAWALYRDTEVGDFIPEKYWSVVALIFKNVWDINQKRRQRKSA
jgi:flagellar biosynthetic protein FlhB